MSRDVVGGKGDDRRHGWILSFLILLDEGEKRARTEEEDEEEEDEEEEDEEDG